MEVQRALQENSTARCPVLGAQYDRKDVSCYMPSQLSANAFYCCWIGAGKVDSLAEGEGALLRSAYSNLYGAVIFTEFVQV